MRGRPPLMRGSDDPGGSATPGRKTGQRDEAAAVQRQLDDLAVVDDLPEPGRLAAQERRVGGHGDRFGQSADLQLEFQSDGFTGGDLRRPRASSGRNPLNSTRI